MHTAPVIPIRRATVRSGAAALVVFVGLVALGVVASQFAGGGTAAAQGADLAQAQTDLDQARAEWAAAVAANGESYDITYRQLCFCPRTPTIAATYVDGVLVSAIPDDGLPLDEWLLWSVPSMFAQIQDAIDQNAEMIHVTYGQHGVPQTISIDYVALIADEEFAMVVSAFAFTDPAPPVVLCNGLVPTIDLSLTPGATGTDGPDVILGTDGPDVIDGLGGDDTICGRRGADTITGGDGDDLLFGGAGRDVLNGGPGMDLLDGGLHIDELRGGGGPDELWGRGGADVLFGGWGTDTLRGGWGADTLHGGRGNDRLMGQAGTDTLFGNNGIDTLFGGRGDDQLDGGLKFDRCFGGSNVTTVPGDVGVSCEVSREIES